MNKMINSILISFLMVITLGITLETQANEVPSIIPKVSPEEYKKQLGRRHQGFVNRLVYRRLARINRYMSGKKYKKSIRILKKLIKKSDPDSVERAKYIDKLGLVYAQDGQYQKAVDSLAQAFHMKKLDITESTLNIYTVGQLYLALEKWNSAIQVLNYALKLSENPSGHVYAMLASAHYQLEDKEKALELIKKAIVSGKKPKKSWLTFALSLNYELKRFPQALALVKKLIARYPSDSSLWRQMSGVYLNMDRPDKALSTLELAHKMGHLEKLGIKNLVSLYRVENIPEKAGRLVQKSLSKGVFEKNKSNYQLLADCWIQAKSMDLALKALESAAGFDSSGNTHLKLAQIHLQNESWKLAKIALSMAIKKGQLKKTEEAYLSLGIAKYYLKDLVGASKAFNKAKEFKTDYVAANTWLSFLQ